MRIVTFYVTHNVTDNIIFFLNHGISTDDKYQYYIIINGNPDISRIYETKPFTNYQSNIHIMNRENKGIDHAGWAYGLKQIDINDYDYFLFLNNTIKGPFIPSWYKEPWENIFIGLLNSYTKLSGISINYCSGRPHVQSMLECLSRDSLILAMNNGFFTNEEDMDKCEIIEKYEIGLSQFFLNQGFNIACPLHAYKDVDFRVHRNNNNLQLNVPWGGDIFFEKGYSNMNVNPLETIFIKTNRFHDREMMEKYTLWSDKWY